MNQSVANNTTLIKRIAQNLGFAECGIAHAAPLDEDAKRLEHWLSKGYQGDMHYMENHFELRVDPQKLVPGAKSVITLLFNYYPTEQQNKELPQIAKYAYGKDYHLVIRDRLNQFLTEIKNQIGDIQGRGFVDSAPVLERAWGHKSGLGWIGKNGNLINKQKGSFFFLATLISDLPLLPDTPYSKDYCGSCTKCIDACPTDAILPEKVLNASQCISYFTIELKSMLLPDEVAKKSNNWIFGCDICQDVCPWNRFSKPNDHTEFEPLNEIITFSISDWMNLDETKFKSIFKDSPLKRSKWVGMKRNLSMYTNR
jgi:epoxyqueuosine reductase